MNILDKTQGPNTQTLYEKVFLSSPDGIVVVDGEGCIIEANPRMEFLFGYACNELLGSPVQILIPERFRPVHPKDRMTYSNHPSMRPMGSGPEFYGRCKDGSEFPVDIILSPVETDGRRLVLVVIRDITERKRLEEEMRHLASSDPLTGLGNYRRLQEAFETETKWFQRTGRSPALLLLDVNGLKKINDTCGHLVGSRALCRLAVALRAECRAIDTATRHGGDEFAVILPDTNAEGARNVARRLETRIANDPEDPPFSFSYGLAVYPRDGNALDQLLAAADRPLYAMKESRR